MLVAAKEVQGRTRKEGKACTMSEIGFRQSLVATGTEGQRGKKTQRSWENGPSSSR